MRLALCIMFSRGELPYLKLHLPVYKDHFDGIVALTDDRTDDGSIAYMRQIGARVYVLPWREDWGWSVSRLFEFAEESNFDAAMRLDPDECIFSEAPDTIRYDLENKATLLCFSRYEFFADRNHYREELFPDWQARAWRLNRGIKVEGKRHEGINFFDAGLREGEGINPNERVMRVNAPQIFHYGYVGKQKLRENQLKYLNYSRVDHGMEPLLTLPPGTPEINNVKTAHFPWDQPISTKICGIYAPWKE